MRLRLGSLGIVWLLAIAAIAAWAPPAFATTQTTITWTYPILPSVNVPDNDGILNAASHTFQEGGMHVESFWVRSNETVFTQGHFHVQFPNPYEASHGGRVGSSPVPNRQGMYLRREDGGPFDLNSLDYRLIQPAAANILIGTTYDPALPATQQLTAFPVVADPNFQTLVPAGFTGVTELFIVWDLTVVTSDAAHIDNIVVTTPTGTCAESQPGGVVVSHAGLTDPTTEGWTADGPGTGVTVGPIAGDLGYDAFFVNDAAAVSGGWRTYVQNLSPDEMCWARTSGFTLRSRVRVANTSDFTDGAVTMSFFDSLRLYELRLGSNGSNDPIASVSGSSVTLTGVGAGYHLYEMVYDPATKTVDLLVDGIERLSNRPGVTVVVRPPNVTFGSANTGSSGTGEGRYALVEFELPPACANGVDDDGDALADFPADPGCSAATDTTETGVCGNEADDDSDGLTDFPNDPGCADFDDGSENAAGLVCDDGADNDGDLAIDFPADSGCFAPIDGSETTACDNGVDDDADGLVDSPADPGCTDPGDDSEQSSSLVCDDGIDNDSDLAIDFPADTGCASSIDATETTACSNGADDDGDGFADLADAGCADANDDSEQSPALVCDDGLDNDGDLAIDFPADAGCVSLADASEAGACGNGFDDDGDGLADLVDPGCADANDDSEQSLALVCDDGLDNDGDTAIDFPADAGCVSLVDASETGACGNGFDDDGDGFADLADAGCADANDDSEQSPALVCDDGLDNDGDTAIDFPADAGCTSLIDASETGACGNGLDDDGDGLADLADAGCADANDDSEQSPLLICDDGLDNDGDTAIDFPADAGCTSLLDASETGVCGNAADDDGDGLADLVDPGCADANDDSEHAPALVCDDGLDNDGDLATDFPADAGCVSLLDASETGVCGNAADDDGDGFADLADPGCADANDDSENSPALVCDDGLDNDGDTAIDCTADAGCVSLVDASETGACGNGLDDDGDGLADLADPGCADANDDSENSPALVCDDGLDNDGDLATDFPADAGCVSLLDATETSACDNGLDDDGDGLADLADAGCANANDDSEKSPTLVCDDGIDNDGDTLIDFPADPGCVDGASNTESPQCNDGVDNDVDGFVDLADPHCASATDDNESAPPVACSDGLDNDGDGLIDYPADPGCLGPASNLENPKCDDDLDNDGDGAIDWDGGVGLGTPDPQCAVAYRDLETPNAPNCGLGTELVIAFPLLSALRRRMRRA